MNWLHYLLEANLYLAVFYAGYYLFLSKETHYTLNRFYLLFGSVVSFILPVVQLGMLKPVERPITAVHFAFASQTATFISAPVVPTAHILTWQDGIMYIYLFGATIVLIVLLIKLYQLLKLTRAKKPGPADSYKVVHINGSDTAFSFFNYLFIGTKVQQAEMIIKHELVHIRQKHSADIIFIELLKIVNWFNPFVYLLQYSLREIHEYIADEKIASSGTDALAYSSFLVSNAYGLSGSSITHSFFNYNLLKKRIIMLHQKRSGRLARLKYLLAIPICGGLLCASTLAFSKTYGWVDIAPPHSNYADTVAQARVIKDTDKTHIPPPPPPAPPVKRVKFPLPKPLPNKTAKGYLYSEAGYFENGKQDVVVTFQEKDGSHKEYDKNKATAADLALLKEKYGYVFRPQLHMLPPPPPPAPPKHMAHKLPPPVVVPDGKTPPPPPPAPPTNKKAYKMPPPPPLDRCFFPLYDYMAANVRYPADAKRRNITGNVVVSFKLNSDNKITEVKLVDAGGNGFDEEVIKALNSCTLAITGATARPYYMLGVSFNIVGGNINLRATSFGPDITNTENYACVVQLNGYTPN